MIFQRTSLISTFFVQQVVLSAILKSKLTGEELMVATTHLKARKGPLLSTLRNEQGKDLLQYLKQEAGGRPVIVSGDFNAEPTEPVYNTMIEGEGNMRYYYCMRNVTCYVKYQAYKIVFTITEICFGYC